MTTTADYFTTNDGIKLVYEVGEGGSSSSTASPVVLVHGWSGSKHYFDHSFAAMMSAPNPPSKVVRYDLRGHGDSDKPSWGYHVARYAADLRDLLDVSNPRVCRSLALEHLNLEDVTVVGTSMGCAIIWSYIELFGDARLKAAVYVDQAPLQNRAADWNLGSKGCYDVASLTRLQELLKHDFPGFAKGNAECCLSNPIDAQYEELLVEETMKASPEGLAHLMGDHTALDWRPLLPRIKMPSLVLVGKMSQIFPWEGVAEVGKMIPGATTVVFPTCDHWLYIEDWSYFSKLVLDFAANGMLTTSSKQ